MAEPQNPQNLTEDDDSVIFEFNGEQIKVPAAHGWSIRDIGVDQQLLKGDCGGLGICSTCHVYVTDPNTKAALAAPSEDELATLAETEDTTDDSRLACQLLYNDSLKDGIFIISNEAYPD